MAARFQPRFLWIDRILFAIWVTLAVAAIAFVAISER
jgi:hypothetical protein